MSAETPCQFDWCETPAEMHAEDPTYHTRELGFGMLLAVDLEGNPYVNWMPDWSEWWAAGHEVEQEFEPVIQMLQGIPANLARFTEALKAS